MHQSFRQVFLLSVISLTVAYVAFSGLQVLALQTNGGGGTEAASASADGQTEDESSPADEQSGWSFLAIVLLIVWGVLSIVAVVILLLPDGRKAAHKCGCLVRYALSVEVGVGGFVQLLLLSALPAFSVAVIKGWHSGEDGKGGYFDWWIFFIVVLTITLVGFISNVLSSSMRLKRFLSPGAGRVFTQERKAATAAILKRLNRCLEAGNTSIDDVKKILSDLLDVVALHVKDHRGSARRDHHDVFANLLFDDGNELIVVCRDTLLHSKEYERQTPKRYPKANMVATRAIQSRKALSVGILTNVYREAPRDRPYKSILAVPLISSNDSQVYGALSIDSTRPYFFESFLEGKAENDLENSLQPYLQTITLIIESLIGRDYTQVVEKLSGANPIQPDPGKESDD